MRERNALKLEFDVHPMSARQRCTATPTVRVRPALRREASAARAPQLPVIRALLLHLSRATDEKHNQETAVA